MTFQVKNDVDLSSLPQWKRHMKWDSLRDVIENMMVGKAIEFEPANQKELKVVRQIVSDYGIKTGKAFSVIKISETSYVLTRTK